MDSFELNKIAGAVLAAVLLIVASKTFIEIAAAPHGGDEHKVVGYELPKPDGAAKSADAHAAASSEAAPAAAAPAAAAEAGAVAPAAEAAPAAAGAAPAAKPAGGFDAAKVASMVGAANAEKGAKLFKKCKACHTDGQGGANKVGPALWGVAGRAKASAEGFKYSEAMKGAGGNWDNEALAHFLHKPKAYIKGTKMIFPGFSKDGDVANIVAYLNTLK